MDFTDYCLGILAVVFGFCIVGEAFSNMGFKGSIGFMCLVIIGVIICKIEDRIRAKKSNNLDNDKR